MSLDEAYEPNNIFAKIIRGDIPSAKVFETDDVLAFMDAFPQSVGHCLVTPTRARAVNLLDAEEETLAALITSTQKLARAVRAALSPDGIRIAQFNGAPAGQTIFHIHFHVIPVYAAAGERPHASGGQADMAELEAVASKIKAQL